MNPCIKTAPGVVYLLTFENGMQYVGMTTSTFSKRFSSHMKCVRNGSNLLIHRTIRKHGIPEVKIIREGCSDINELREIEVAQIHLLNTLVPNGYNLTRGGEGTQGWFSAASQATQLEARERSSRVIKQARARNGDAFMAGARHMQSEVGRKQVGERTKQRWINDPEFRELALKNITGRDASDKLWYENFMRGIATRGRNPAWKKAQVERLATYYSVDENAKKAREALAKRNADPEFQKARMERVMAAIATPEWKANNAAMNEARRKIKDSDLQTLIDQLAAGTTKLQASVIWGCSTATVANAVKRYKSINKQEM